MRLAWYWLPTRQEFLLKVELRPFGVKFLTSVRRSRRIDCELVNGTSGEGEREEERSEEREKEVKWISPIWPCWGVLGTSGWSRSISDGNSSSSDKRSTHKRSRNKQNSLLFEWENSSLRNGYDLWVIIRVRHSLHWDGFRIISKTKEFPHKEDKTHDHNHPNQQNKLIQE